MTMGQTQQFYINGEWVNPETANDFAIIDPASENEVGQISLGSKADVDKAVAAAKRAFETWGMTTKKERLELLNKLVDIYERRSSDMALAISTEMGAPIDLASGAQAGAGIGHLRAFIKALEAYDFDYPLRKGDERYQIHHEPVGVCALITPWNWPINQIALKVGAALATGCTMVLKPSEIAPLSGLLFAEFIDEAGFPPGVFNLVNGDGLNVGTALTGHPDIDMVSFTGSTRAGIEISKNAAGSIKRVALELGGKSPNIVFADCDVARAVKSGVIHCFHNTGQSCNAPTRMLVEQSVYDEAVEVARATAAKTEVGQPTAKGRHIGPLVSEMHFNKVQALIQKGIDEGAKLVAGGTGKPEGFEAGYFVRPTIFAGVDNTMTIAREEVFGPVLVMIPFETEEQAIEIANDTPYGLAAYVQTGDDERAARVSRQLKAGMVMINGAPHPDDAPFGGYKQSGIGREGGRFGLEDFLETKSVCAR
jgi:aldehyde dehydrogenase (NAD+)